MISPDRLIGFPLFMDLPDRYRRELVARMEELKVEAGHVIFSEGDTGDALYFIVDGRVSIQKAIDRKIGAYKTLSQLSSGDFFGEMALLENAPRWASAVAVKPTLLVTLSARDVRAWLTADEQVPLRFVVPFIQSLNGRLRQATREMILLFEVSRVLAQQENADALAAQLTEVLARAFDDGPRVAFYLWNEYSGEYELKAHSSWPTQHGGSRGEKDPLFAWMAEKRECVLAGDWPTDPRFNGSARSAWPAFRAVLAAPVAGERRPVGYVVLGHETDSSCFNGTHRRVLAGVVNLVAPAFENAFLRQERSAQERLARTRHGAIDY
ncbi:MAG: cyclic nucleotide-binding domain-containing protein [Elusimicrobia bacterium]|nr:cyclic nucleotide-binding domain-containing protein [Elusimicrobiota bacterium]MBP9698594.1 cyclic nucleotide-binding domain-containing protein [Elusimicrobiota bacterium]